MTQISPPSDPTPRVALASCMRNEGVFLLERLAHHQALGFDKLIVVTNDCTDGSDDLLDILASHGIVFHIRQDIPGGMAPQDAGMDHVLDHLRAAGFSHVLHIDSDEFLALYTGTLRDLVARTARADVVPIAWQMFGDCGLIDWQPGDLVTERNIRSEPAPEPGETKFKCLFRIDSFARATDHNPLEPQVPAPCVMTPDGDELSNASLFQRKSSRFRPHDIAASAGSARLFHYAVKSQDCFLLKNQRGDGQGNNGHNKYHLNSRWHVRANPERYRKPISRRSKPCLAKNPR